MPDPFERHGRSREPGWGPVPSRSQARAAAASDDPVTPEKRPKNRVTLKRECRSSPDGAHKGEVQDKNQYDSKGRKLTCYWNSIWVSKYNPDRLAHWVCFHVLYCKNCGAKLEEHLTLNCPLYPGTEGEKEAAEQRSRDWQAERAAAPVSERMLRKIPNGRQSYRKPKEGK